MAEITSTVAANLNQCYRYDSNTVPIGPVSCSSTSTAGASSLSSIVTSTSVAASSQISHGSVSISQTPNPAPVSTGPTATGTTPAASPKNGLAGGAVAGVAIGMLLAGILIAGAVFFFLLRRQKNRQTASYPVSHLPPQGYASGPEKVPVVRASAVSSSIDNLIPQPVSDDEITNEISKIRDNIKNHVRTYCHSAPVTAGINEAALRNVASASGLSNSALVGALLNPSTRQEILRLIVAWVVLSKSAGGRNASLLPFELSGLSATIASTNDNTTQSTLYSKWKTITGVLLQQQLGKNAHDPNRTQAFANIIAELDSILAPFVQGSVDGAQRRKNLDMILTRSANLAFLLFSQPGSFHFDFASRRGGALAFPTLVQTIGDQGQVLSPPRVLSEGEFVAV